MQHVELENLHSSAEALVASLQVGNVVGNQTLKGGLRSSGEDDKVLHLHVVDVGLVSDGNGSTSGSRLVTGVHVRAVDSSRRRNQASSNDGRVRDGEGLRALVLLLSVGVVAVRVVLVGPRDLDDRVGLDLPNANRGSEPAVTALGQEPCIL